MMSNNNKNWDHEFDVVVVGSGAGALTTSIKAHDLGLKVLVIEKSDLYGGTSAISGGGIWIPNNHQISQMGQKDNDEAGVEYIKNVIQNPVEDGRIEAYVANARKMVKYLEDNSHVKFEAQAEYTDYYPELDHGMPGYRSMDPIPFDARKLGDQFDLQRPPGKGTLMMGRMTMSVKEARQMLTRAPGWIWTNMKVMIRYYTDIGGRIKGPKDRHLTLGGALIGSLRKSMMDRDIPLWLSSPMEKLVQEDGRVTGITIRRNGKVETIHARKGVVLGAGGFEQNQAMREKYHPQPSNSSWSATPAGNNTGDAIRAGLEVGAQTALMDHSWWAPTTTPTGEPQARALFVERALPGCIMVNSSGKRFVNEAAPYSDIGYAMYDTHKEGVTGVPCWFVFDATFRNKYPCGAVLPGYAQPDAALPKRLKDYFVKADTLEALAEKIGIDKEGLVNTVADFNVHAKDGKDPEFNKGESLFDRFYGDPGCKPNPCVAPVEKGPFYALKVNAGDIGTKGGLYTDVNARVLHENGEAIEGLYAIGNTSSSVMAHTYPGAGSTIGPAMTFGYLAAEHLSQYEPKATTENKQEVENAVEA
ncbi:FAD-binding protein [Endozoicomonas arenosclerae]|uniref:FAD-binding protein n=1 Tax=Endozoicomonas arenosclerae TaxID=1633495 RepID=UPI0007833B78|nr:FAD-binding protein [Endozoicomonas arenosclerae]